MGQRDDELEKVAKERMRDMPAETAGGRIDPQSLPEDQREELSTRVPRGDADGDQPAE